VVCFFLFNYKANLRAISWSNKLTLFWLSSGRPGGRTLNTNQTTVMTVTVVESKVKSYICIPGLSNFSSPQLGTEGLNVEITPRRVYIIVNNII
jgi:hypothetical protein